MELFPFANIVIGVFIFIVGFTLFMMTGGIMKELEQHRNTLETMKFDGDDIIEFVFEMIAAGLKPRDKEK